MRIILSSILLLLSVNYSFSQLSVRIYNYRPTGEFGFVMKPTFSAEIGFMTRFEKDRWRTNAVVSFLVMKPRMESFPISGVLTDGSGTKVLPGEQSFQKYNMGLLSGGFDFAFIKKKTFAFYLGTDIIVGAVSVDYTHRIETFIDESYQGGGILGGIRFRVGGEYLVNDDMGIFLNANRNVYLVAEPSALLWANDYGIGVHYLF